MSMGIEPHGGKLINRILEGSERDEWLNKAVITSYSIHYTKLYDDYSYVCCFGLSA